MCPAKSERLAELCPAVVSEKDPLEALEDKRGGCNKDPDREQLSIVYKEQLTIEWKDRGNTTFLWLLLRTAV